MEEGAPGQKDPVEEGGAPGGSRRTASQISAGDDIDQRCRAELNLREKEMDNSSALERRAAALRRWRGETAAAELIGKRAAELIGKRAARKKAAA
jgi:hypothetical protein